MDFDTIFPALSNGEPIVGKYIYAGCWSNVQTTAILTSSRLLIRRKYTVCCCCSRSSYTSIALDSISRVDDQPANTGITFTVAMLIIFLGSVALLGSGLQLDDDTLKISAAIGIILPTVGLILNYLLNRSYLIILHGTFGSESLILDEILARDLEGKLIEMSFQTQFLFARQGAMNYEQSPASASPSGYILQPNPVIPSSF